MDLNEIPTRADFARHPWETARADFFAQKLAPVVSAGATRVLDAGSGDAWLARQFLSRYPALEITCFDPGYADARPETVDGEHIQFTESFPSGTFDVVTVLDVLEHVEDDRALLSELVAALRPGGYVLASVPAWQQLFSKHDVALLHYRRYSTAQFQALLSSIGLTILESGGLFHSLLPARWAGLKVERLRGDNGPADVSHSLEWRGSERSRRLVAAALRADARLTHLMARRRVDLPGLSTWALCRTGS